MAHFFLLKITPLALILDHVALKHFRVRHLEDRKLRLVSFEVLQEFCYRDWTDMKMWDGNVYVRTSGKMEVGGNGHILVFKLPHDSR